MTWTPVSDALPKAHLDVLLQTDGGKTIAWQSQGFWYYTHHSADCGFFLIKETPLAWHLLPADYIRPEQLRRLTTSSFPGNLLKAREALNLTQSELGEKATLNASVVSFYESGLRYPSIENFVKLCNALGCSADYLLRP